MFGSKKTYINDRYFITNSLGYNHLGNSVKPNVPMYFKHKTYQNPYYQNLVVGDDLGSVNYLLG